MFENYYYINSINIQISKKNFFFVYDLNSKSVQHKFNNINLKSKKDYLNKMLISILDNKANFEKNKNVTLFSCLMIEKIRSKIDYYQ